MNLNIAVVDDQRIDAEKLSRVIQRRLEEKYKLSGTLAYYPDGQEFLKNFEPDKFNLVFMDILMNDMNGIDTAKRIRDFDNNLLLVFTTSSREFVFDAFPLHAFDYVLKPYDSERLAHVLDEAVKILQAPDPVINVRLSRSTYSVPLRNISAVSSSDHFCKLTLTDGRCLLCSMTFSEIEAMLNDDSRFLTCNRGIIINMDHVSSLTRDKDVFIMKDSTRYPVRFRGRSKIIELFTQYQILRLRGGIRH